MKSKEKKIRLDVAVDMLSLSIKEQMKDMTEDELRYIYKQIINVKKIRK